MEVFGWGAKDKEAENPSGILGRFLIIFTSVTPGPVRKAVSFSTTAILPHSVNNLQI
jgi:hypothetical protein